MSKTARVLRVPRVPRVSRVSRPAKTGGRARPRWTPLFRRHGLWTSVRNIPPGDHLGPAIGLGLVQLRAWGVPRPQLKRFVATANRAETMTFMCLCAAIGESMTQAEFNELLAVAAREPGTAAS
jgi:hypothetical protein